MVCPNCRSSNTKVRWSWERKKQETVGPSESSIEFSRFISRSSRFICRDCGESFLTYSKNYDLVTPSNNILVDTSK